jgi:hypothetical protein
VGAELVSDFAGRLEVMARDADWDAGDAAFDALRRAFAELEPVLLPLAEPSPGGERQHPSHRARRETAAG